MEDKSLPKSVGEDRQPPQLSPRQGELCKRLDRFWKTVGNFGATKPSDMFRGAIYTIQYEHRSINPEWMPQAAHSLREILYPFWKGEDKKKEYLKLHGSTGDKEALTKDISEYFGFVTSIAHHQPEQARANPIFGNSKPAGITAEIFIESIARFENLLFRALRRQIDAHKEIEEFLKGQLSQAEYAHELIGLNQDTRQYFFTKADDRWVDWLWENGFLDAVKEKAEDPTRYGYPIPELNYLAKVADKEPTKVVDIMLAVPVSAVKFNPEVVNRFLRICSTLPAEQLARLVPKIRDENWVRLMGGFNNWGFEYEKILEVLANAKDYNSLLTVAQTILTVRTKEGAGKAASEITNDNPFYFNDLGYTKVFERLVAIDNAYAERILALATETIREIFLIGAKDSSDEAFGVGEAFYLWDVDFFKLELDEKDRLSYRDDVRNLAATMKQFAVRTIGEQCSDPDLASMLYAKYFEPLPDSRSMWHLRLFVLSLCPAVFKDELQKAFFKIFRADDKPWGLIGGAEYRRALHAGFEVLSVKDKRDYVTRVLEYFGKRSGDDVNLWKSYGWSILSSIFVELMDEEKRKAEEVLGKPLDPNFEPEPSIRIGEFTGSIIPQAPDDKDWSRPASEIVEKLCSEWSPRALAEKYKDTDFNRPTGAEGAGERLKKEISQRPQEFLENARLFFDRESLDPHYTYSFLQGIHEVLRNKQVANVNIKPLLEMLSAIVASDKKGAFKSGPREKEISREWLSSWSTVHNAMADVTKELLSGSDKELILDFSTNRDGLLELISYLLKHSDPAVKDEEEKPPRISSGGEAQYTGSDPFTTAINSVRGRAFEALVNFLYWDDKQFAKDVAIRINGDVKLVYEELLGHENTRAVMFMFGHYLPSFYFRDKTWIRNLLPKIFPEDVDKKDLYLAAWEGFLTNNLYGDMLSDPTVANLYSRGIKFRPEDYTKRRYFKNLDEGLATHMALAFVHFPEFGFEHELFKQFWTTENQERHGKFISFVGRYSISREAANEWIKQNKIDVEKLKRFWDWTLEHCSAKALSGFGYWVKVKSDVLETKWLTRHIRQTLEKTNGHIDWEYSLMRSLPVLVKEAPEDTLAILRLYFLEEVAKHEPQRSWLHVDSEAIYAFRVLYQHLATKEGVRALINDLLPYRNGLFWKLESVLDDDQKK